MEDKPKTPLSNLDISEALGKDTSRLMARSRAIRFFRLLFPVLAIIIFFSIFVFNDRKNVAEIRPIEEVAPRKMGENELIKPKFRSEDDKDQPYTIEADRAFQTQQNEDFVKLENPTADLSLKDGTWLNMEANEGLYDQKKQILDLKGNVGLSNTDGYIMTTKQIYLNMEDRSADTNEAVNLNGPDAVIDASGFSADSQTSTFTFKGPARMIIRETPAQNQPSQNQPSEE